MGHGFRENIHANQHLLGMIYMSELAKGTVEIGHEIEIKDKYGNFEIKGFDQEYLKSQSKRRENILKTMNEKGLSGAKSAQYVCLGDRKTKEAVKPETLKEYWLQDAKAQGVNFADIYKKSLDNIDSKTKGIITQSGNVGKVPKPISLEAKSAVQEAIKHLSQYNVKLTHSDIIKQAFEFAGYSVDYTSMEQSISQMLKSGELKGKADEYYTTKPLLESEKTFKAQAEQSKQTSYSVSANQSGVSATILSNRDRIQIIDVKGFKNESGLINDLVNHAETNGVNAYALGQTKDNMSRLQQDVSRETTGYWQAFKNHFRNDLMQTINHFKSTYTQAKGRLFENENDCIIVTEAQKLCYQEIMALDDLAKDNGGKLVLLNNIKSQDGFAPGNSIKALKDIGIETHLSQTQSKDAVVEIIETSKLDINIAHYYTSLNKQDRHKTQVVAINTKTQDNLNTEIRSHLQDRGELSLQQIEHTTLSTKGLSDAQKAYAKYYSVGDQVTLNPFKENQAFYRVASSNTKDNELLLINQKGDELTLNLDEKGTTDTIQVNKLHTLQIAVGEQLRLDRHLYSDTPDSLLGKSDKLKFEKGETITVTAITNDGIRFCVGDMDSKNSNDNNSSNSKNGNTENRQVTFWLSKDRLTHSYLSYAYAVKPHQLKETDHVITSLSSYQINKNNLGVIGEYAPKITLFCDDKEKAITNMNTQSINWLANDIAHLKPDNVYSPVVRVDQAIINDLQKVASSLLKVSEMNTHELNSADNLKDKLNATVSYAMAKLSEREAAFEMSELLQESLTYGMGQVTLLDVQQCIDEKTKAGELLINDKYVTTKQAYELEKNILNSIDEGKNTVTPVIDKAANLLNLPDFLTQGQKDAVTLALTTSDRSIGVNGLAGTGKTTMMKQIKEIAEENGYKLVGIAPTHKAVKMLDESMNESNKTNNTTTKDSFERFKDIGIEVMTAAKFVNEDMSKYNSKTIFITDESSMLSNREFNAIEQKVTSLGARNIYSGDKRQQQSLGSGKPFELAMQYGMKYASMNEIVRQKGSPDLVTAANLASQYKAEQSLSQLATMNPFDYINREGVYSGATTSFIEVKGEDTIYESIANDYLTREKAQRNNTLVIAPMHKQRAVINGLIREGLKKEDVIKDSINVTRLKSKNMNKAEVLHVKNYAKGDIIKFGASYSMAKAGEFVTVNDIDETNNLLKISDDKKNQLSINPAKIALKSNMSVYEKEQVELGIGDKIRLRHSNKKRGWLGAVSMLLNT